MDWSARLSAKSLAMSRIRAPVLVGLLCALFAAATIACTVDSAGEGAVAILWPANAVVLAMVMLRPPGRWWPVLLAGFLGDLAGGAMTRDSVTGPLLFGLVNIGEVVIAAVATQFARGENGLAGNARTMIRFAASAGIMAPSVSALGGGAIFAGLYGQSFPQAYCVWFFAGALGLMVFTPFFYALFAGDYARSWRGMSRRRRGEAVTLLVLTTLVILLTFLARRPLLFLILMPTMLVAFRTGWLGVRVVVALTAMIGAVATTSGLGPIPTLSGSAEVQAHYFQIFIAAQLVMVWPVIAALSARDRLLQELAESERSLRFLAAQSSVLMLTFDVEGICRKAVGADDLLPRRSTLTLPGLPIEALVVPAGPALREAHEMAIDIGRGVRSAEFRLEDGRWLEAVFRPLDHADGRCAGSAMTLHDISVRKEQALALTRTAQTDSLTGLLNRAGFLKVLEQELRFRPSGTLSLAMIDVDRFKSINDTWGHQAGDAVLCEIARRITRHLPPTAYAGRLGGDEFVVLLGSGESTEARELCLNMVRTVAAEPVRWKGGRGIDTAISCGLAQHRQGLSADQFLHAADVALYEAKRGGRNQMVAA
jgi:diguanylate cyclase (GGDEF)-like protein